MHNGKEFILIILVYVDLIFVASDSQYPQSVIDEILGKFEGSDEGTLQYYLGGPSTQGYLGYLERVSNHDIKSKSLLLTMSSLADSIGRLTILYMILCMTCMTSFNCTYNFTLYLGGSLR